MTSNNLQCKMYFMQKQIPDKIEISACFQRKNFLYNMCKM